MVQTLLPLDPQDIADPEDDDDPGWAVLKGDSPQHRRAPVRSFPAGSHTLTVQAWDNSDQETRATIVLEVVPVPEPRPRQLLLVDNVLDFESGAWLGVDEVTPLDQDAYRDEFWIDLLESTSSGVVDWSAEEDVIDVEFEQMTYRDAVRYKAMLFTTRYAVQNYIWNTLKPRRDGSSPFNWMTAFQRDVGNLFLAGTRVANEFIEDAGRNWMLPIIFDTNEFTSEFGGNIFHLGFGTRALPDGTTQLLGRERYPYSGLGLAMIDHFSPKYNVYGQTGQGSVGNSARASSCVGLKGLLVDSEFKANYTPQGGVFPDTIFTEPTIDWKDLAAAYRDSLKPFDWGTDEFYDGNISTRATPWTVQFCEGVPCVDPMFRAYSRFDWIKDLHVASGDNAWPRPMLAGEDLLIACGRHALDTGTGRTRTTGQIVGFITHKLEATKPRQVGDVVWGFDPYRFDHSEIRQAIYWILGEHFGLDLY